MKKLFLVSAVLLAAIPASQAGIGFNIGFGLPLPPLPRVIISRPSAVVVAPAPVVCGPAAPVVVLPSPYYQYYYPHRHGYFVRRGAEHFRGYR